MATSTMGVDEQVDMSADGHDTLRIGENDDGEAPNSPTRDLLGPAVDEQTPAEIRGRLWLYPKH